MINKLLANRLVYTMFFLCGLLLGQAFPAPVKDPVKDVDDKPRLLTEIVPQTSNPNFANITEHWYQQLHILKIGRNSAKKNKRWLLHRFFDDLIKFVEGKKSLDPHLESLFTQALGDVLITSMYMTISSDDGYVVDAARRLHRDDCQGLTQYELNRIVQRVDPKTFRQNFLWVKQETRFFGFGPRCLKFYMLANYTKNSRRKNILYSATLYWKDGCWRKSIFDLI